VTLRQLAHDAAMSPYHFLRTFNVISGVTPYQIRPQSAAKACSSAAAADNRSDLGDRLRGGLQRPFDLQSPLPAYHGYDARFLANGTALVLSATAFRRRSISGATGCKPCRCRPGWRERQLQLGMTSGLAEGTTALGHEGQFALTRPNGRVSVQLADPRRDARQRTRRADSGTRPPSPQKREVRPFSDVHFHPTNPGPCPCGDGAQIGVPLLTYESARERRTILAIASC
jgi:hypothetical protein